MYNFLFICWGYCGVSEQGIVCNTLPKLWRKFAENFRFVMIGKGASLAVNSPLFYRLNYARITRHIITLKSAQVKDFVKILQRFLYTARICLLGHFLPRCRLGVDEKKSGKNHELFAQQYSVLFRCSRKI